MDPDSTGNGSPANLEDAGTYLFTAHYGGSTTLSTDVSDDCSFPLAPQDPNVALALLPDHALGTAR